MLYRILLYAIVKMTSIFPLSPWNFSTFKQCPFKFWCQKDPEIKPLPERENVYSIFGKNLHKIIYNYYQKVKEQEISTGDIHCLLEDVINEQSPVLGISDIKNYANHLRNFEEFEADRIKKGWQVLEVEKEVINGKLKGILDAIFRDKAGNIIIVDWKTGKWRDDFLMQGYIYQKLLKADKVLFYQTLNGFEHILKEKELIKGKNMVIRILEQIKAGVNEKRRNRFCCDCEYSIACGLDDLGLRLEEI